MTCSGTDYWTDVEKKERSKKKEVEGCSKTRETTQHVCIYPTNCKQAWKRNVKRRRWLTVAAKLASLAQSEGARFPPLLLLWGIDQATGVKVTDRIVSLCSDHMGMEVPEFSVYAEDAVLRPNAPSLSKRTSWIGAKARGSLPCKHDLRDSVMNVGLWTLSSGL